MDAGYLPWDFEGAAADTKVAAAEILIQLSLVFTMAACIDRQGRAILKIIRAS